MKKLITFLAALALMASAQAQVAVATHAADAGSIYPQAAIPGDVVGPASSTNNAFARFSGTTGKVLQDSPDLTYSTPTLSVPDAFNVSSAGSISLTAGGSNKNITLTPSGTGYVSVPSNRLEVGSVTDPTVLINISVPLVSGKNICQSAQSVIQSSLTTTAYGYAAGLFTQATSFNLATIRNFAAFGPVRGSGSTITTNVGFYSANTTAATNNYAFQGQMNSATNSYNLYMDGTAQNLFNGNLLFGSGAKITQYNGLTTAGMGVPTILSAPAISATKTANFTVVTFTPAASAAQYRIDGVITTTSSTNTGTVQFTVDYVDSQGTTHTGDIIGLVDALGVTGTTKTGASKEFAMVPRMITVNNSATNIVIKVVTVGTVSYTVASTISRLN